MLNYVTSSVLEIAIALVCFANRVAFAQDTSWYQPIKEYKDSTVYTMGKFLDMNYGNGKVHPQRFSMHIPPRLKKQELIDIDYTVLAFPSSQRIIISMHHIPKEWATNDSTWFPTTKYVEDLVDKLHEAFREGEVRLMIGRNSQVFRKQGHEVILLNIKPENYPRFVSAVNTFRILPDSTPRVREAYPKAPASEH